MQLTRVRFTVRGLMIFVVGMAAIFGSATMYRRHLLCREVAEFYEYQAAEFAHSAEFFRKEAEAHAVFAREFGVAEHERPYIMCRELASRYAEAAAAFRRAASRPWLAVPPALN